MQTANPAKISRLGMLLLLLCTRFCLMLDSFPKALYNSDMRSTKQEIQAIKIRLKAPTKANTKQKIK